MNTIYILGENSFIAKHVYIKIKQHQKYNIILLNHKNYVNVHKAQDTDIIINFCGVNRSLIELEYQEGNHIFLQKILENLTNNPFFIHISSLMVYGFENKNLQELTDYQKWFIQSKLDGELYLQNNYRSEKLCIIRPSNIYGYDCNPYYNNLLSSLVYEKINDLKKITNININCIRNMLSVNNLANKLYEIIVNKINGIYNIISNNNSSLGTILNYIYDNDIPNHIKLSEGDIDNIDMNKQIVGNNIIIVEDLHSEIINLEKDMMQFLNLKNNVSIKQLSVFTQPRGNMIEITDLQSKRLYKITLTQHSVRGNHYHYQQIEEFYTNKHKVVYIFCYSINLDVIFLHVSNENELIHVNPYIIHTLSNDFIDNEPEIFVSSTQEFIKESIPDTEYINIIY